MWCLLAFLVESRGHILDNKLTVVKVVVQSKVVKQKPIKIVGFRIAENSMFQSQDCLRFAQNRWILQAQWTVNLLGRDNTNGHYLQFNTINGCTHEAINSQKRVTTGKIHRNNRTSTSIQNSCLLATASRKVCMSNKMFEEFYQCHFNSPPDSQDNCLHDMLVLAQYAGICQRILVLSRKWFYNRIKNNRIMPAKAMFDQDKTVFDWQNSFSKRSRAMPSRQFTRIAVGECWKTASETKKSFWQGIAVTLSSYYQES